MELAVELEELMVGMMELPLLYNALFPASNAPNIRVASEVTIRASESFKKQELLSAHKADIAKFTSWLQYVDAITASKEKEKLNGTCCNQGKGLLLRLRESVVEIPPRPPAPLGTLKPIKVSELHLDRQHYGRVLYGNLCAKAFKMTAVLTLLEEPKTGHVVKLAIYNAVPSTSNLAEVQTQFPEGSRVAIKEPYFKRYKDQTVGLRVNNPGDVVFVDSSLNAPNEKESLIGMAPDNKSDKLDYDELRLEGNRAFSSGDWKGAVQFYTKSLNMALSLTSSWKLDDSTCGRVGGQAMPGVATKKLPSSVGSNDFVKCNGKSQSKRSAKKVSKQRNGSCDQSRIPTKANLMADLKAEAALLAAYSNRSETWLRLHKYEEALVDAENALKIDPAHVKSMFRRGRALHCLQQYSKAVQCLQSALRLSPNDGDLEKALKESLTGDLQSRLGVYNLSSYYLSNFSGSPPTCADFVGPVKVKMLETKYGGGSGQRGLVVMTAMKAGDLLLVSNPLAVARVEGENIEFHLIPATRRMNDASQEDLVTQLYNFARISPRALHQLHSLYNGSTRGTEPSMELFVPGTTVFPRDNSSCGAIQALLSCCGAPAQPDITNIRHIVQWNAFDEHGYATKGGRRGLRGFCSGIWVLPSFINHSCLPNASRVHVGDAMMIHAARSLEPGEEVCLPYFDILCPLPQRREKSLRGWGFICNCPRCSFEETLEKDLQHLTDRYCQLEEDAMPGIQSEPTVGVAKMSSSYVGSGFLTQTTQFLSLARDVEALLTTSKFAQLSTQRRNWIRASYAIAYIVGNSSIPAFPHKVDVEARMHYLNALLESLGEVFPGNSQTLSTATMLMEELRKQHGLKSQPYKHAEDRALNICRCMFGNQKVPVLRSLIKAMQEGLLEA